MLRLVALVSLALSMIQGDAAQSLGILHITVSIADTDGRPVPVGQYALLVSDAPPTSAPRRVVTTQGAAEIRLRPGTYIVESDRPAVMQGRAYQWRQVVHLVAGRDTTLALTAANADVSAATADMEVAPAAEEPGASPALTGWQDSVVALWTEHRHASGFLVSGDGLIATSRSSIGEAATLEVQLSPTEKVPGRVIANDPAQDVAIVRIGPAAVGNRRPVSLDCGSATPAAVTIGQDLWTFDVPLLGAKSGASGAVVAQSAQAIDTDFALPPSSAGGPVFAGVGPAVGLTSIPNADDASGAARVSVVRTPAICAAVASAEQRVAAEAPPIAVQLPVESPRPLPLADMQSAAKARVFGLAPYAASSSDFDILFVTPVLLAGAESLRARTDDINDTFSGVRTVSDFGEWAEYVSQSPPVLFIRVTPKLVESFWMKVARGAASTQGASIPPIKHVGAGFSRMRVLCGSREITPVHPFVIRARVSDTEAVDEGFYAIDPMAIGPQCGTVSLVLSSAKDPNKTETRVIDPAIVARVWRDFAAYLEK